MATFRRIPDLSGVPDGTPLAEMAADHGVTVDTVRRWLATGRPMKAARPAKPRPSVDTEKIVALYLEGRTQRQVAEVLDCSVSAVSAVGRRVQAAGVGRHPDPARHAEIARRYQGGASLVEVAAAMGMSKSGVWNAMVRREIGRRPWGTRGGAKGGPGSAAAHG